MNDATGRNTARRRRADTIARCERIMETARRLPFVCVQLVVAGLVTMIFRV